MNLPLDEFNQFQLKNIIENLQKLNLNFHNCAFSYKSVDDDMFQFLGIYEEASENTKIQLEKLGGKNIIILKYRRKKILLNELFEEQSTNLIQENSLADKSFEANYQRKIKEKSIREVVEKVALWRKLYNGFYDENQQLIKLSLNDAAIKIGIQKKTLDDYLFQIRYTSIVIILKRLGRKYGFNFNKYKDDRIGKLRAFVKQNKEKDPIFNVKKAIRKNFYQ